jgi:hypothetical protein
MSASNSHIDETNSQTRCQSFSSSTSDDDEDFMDDDDSNDRSLEATEKISNNRNKNKKTLGRVKIKMAYIDNKIRRYTTFSKRKTGIMKKAYELATLTGTEVMLLVASETGKIIDDISIYSIILFRSCLYICHCEITTNDNE